MDDVVAQTGRVIVIMGEVVEPVCLPVKSGQASSASTEPEVALPVFQEMGYGMGPQAIGMRSIKTMMDKFSLLRVVPGNADPRPHPERPVAAFVKPVCP